MVSHDITYDGTYPLVSNHIKPNNWEYSKHEGFYGKITEPNDAVTANHI